MIVPRSRLLWIFALLVIPLTIVIAFRPTDAKAAGMAIAVLLALFALDAIASYGSLEGIMVEPEEAARLAKDREGAINLRIKNEGGRPRWLRLGLAFPREIQSPQESLATRLPGGSEYSQCSWPCTPRERGRYLFEKCYVEGTSLLGLWAIRTSLPLNAEAHVYPNLFSERKHVAALFLNRGDIGTHAQRQVGKGREFEHLRNYTPGDTYDEIHWKTTAKRGHPVTKVFQIERTQEVYVIIDASRLSARISDPNREHRENLLERFVNSALILALAAERQGDLFGVLTFSNKIHNFVRAKNGTFHYNVCRDALYLLQPQIVTPDFDEVCSFIRLRLRRRALLVFLTCLDDPILAENFVHSLDLICRQHLILVNMVGSEGVQPIFSRDAESVEDIYHRLGGHILWQELGELEKVLQRRGVRFSLLEDEKMCAQLISQYVNIKQRQLL